MVALRDGMINVVPMILVGSTFLLLGSQADIIRQYFPALAQSPFGQWYAANVGLLLIPYRFTMGLLSLYAAFTIASCLAREYGLPTLPQGLGAVAALLLTSTPVQMAVEDKKVWMLTMPALSADGLFMAIIIGLLSVEIARRLMPKPQAVAEGSPEARIPSAVKDAFGSFVPMLVVVTLVWTLRHLLGIDLQAGLSNALQPFERLGDSLGCVLLVNLVMHLLTICGVHGISVINAVFFALWQKFLLDNTTAHQAGLPLPWVTAYPFFQWFIWMGGTGITLPLNVFLLRSRSAHARYVGRISLIPSLFNVNEPILFGLPVVANPVLAIPFIVAPLLCGTIAFLALQHHLVARPFIEVPWVLPCILGAPLATQDWRAAVLVLINLAVTTVIWWPFWRVYEKKLIEDDAREE